MMIELLTYAYEENALFEQNEEGKKSFASLHLPVINYDIYNFSKTKNEEENLTKE